MDRSSGPFDSFVKLVLQLLDLSGISDNNGTLIPDCFFLPAKKLPLFKLAHDKNHLLKLNITVVQI